MSADIIALYLAQLPDDPAELDRREQDARARLEKARQDYARYDKIGARSTTREAQKRNARRAGVCGQQARTAEEQLEAIARKRAQTTAQED